MIYEIKRLLAERIQPFWLFCREKKRMVWLLAAVTAGFIALQTAADKPADRVCIRDENGRLMELRLEEGGTAVSVPLTVEARRNGERVREEVILTLQRSSQKKNEGISSEQSESPEDLQQELQEVLTGLSDGESSILLPERLTDGTRLFWSQSRGRSSLLAALLILPLGMLFLYRDRQQKVIRSRKRQVDEIRRGLPSFHDQLLLLLSSGLIFHDAFARIAEGSRRRQTKDALQLLIMEVESTCQETSSSLITVLEEKAREVGVREFSRMVRIISENQSKGVDLKEKLESESEILWNQRKKLAEERGKAAETKLSFPLAVLLVVLIVITASPAILDM